ncbi:MAG: molybdopterin-binding protein [Desulfobacula sp.]
MKEFPELLEDSAKAHGHLCPGQVVGVRMAMLGCRLIGLNDLASNHDQIKKLIVYVEMDRCTADAVAHDITEIRPGEFKGTAFTKGHTICNEDICHLQKLGKNHLYLIDLEDDEIHENEAAVILAKALAGPGIIMEETPKEGKICLMAETDGLLKVDKAALAAFNMIDEVMCASLHSYTPVKKGARVGATRAIPLVMKRAPVERAAAIAAQNGGVLSVLPLKPAKAGIVITGNEVFSGLIKDGFAPVLKKKVADLGSIVSGIEFAPDDEALIQQAVEKHLADGCDLILLTGGMSVDPDDVTRKGIARAGATEMHYGAAALPGAMFMDCPECVYPQCPFGKGV